MARLTQEQAKQVYDILVKYGARDDEYSKGRFVDYLTTPNRHEYRFCGIFGTGGKLRTGGLDQDVSADMYRENETPALVEQMKRLNAELAVFKTIE